MNLSHNNLVEFPVGFCGLKHLNSINLSNNSLTKVRHKKLGSIRVSRKSSLKKDLIYLKKIMAYSTNYADSLM